MEFDPSKAKSDGPASDHDWTIRALNIHGAFFEAWCRDLVDRVPGWSLRYYNYPVDWLGDESALDVRADSQVGLQRLSFLIECKKNNPDLTEWVFFRKRRVFTASPTPVYHAQLIVNAEGAVSPGETSFRGFPWTSVVAEDGRETRGNYRAYKKDDKTKTSNRDITEAARQVCLAYRAITGEETRSAGRSIDKSMINTYPRWLIFVPIIVTTARLHVCDFQPPDVDPKTGELPLDRAKLTEVTHLRFEYPMPRSLQWDAMPPKPGDDLPDWSEPMTRQWVGIVNAAYFEPFLTHYAEHWHKGIHMPAFPDQPPSPLP